MSLSVTIHITGDKEVMRRVEKLGTDLYRLRPAMDVIGKGVAEYYSTIGITDRGKPWNNPWPDYSPTYKIWKEINYPGRPMMVLGGPKSENLKDSFAWQATNTGVRIYNTASYFKYHQSSAPRTKIPRRQIMGINNPIRRMVSEAIKLEIRRKILETR